MSNTWHRKAIALTGGYGSGKSTVASIFRNLGARVLDADQLAREVVQARSSGLVEIAEKFGPEFIQGNGELDRQKMAQVVFESPAMLKQLEQITHPKIALIAAKRAEKILSDHPSQLLLYDCPLLFESGLDAAGFKKIICVYAPQSVCVARIKARDGLAEDLILKRIKTQLSLEEKKRRADIVIDNTGSLEELTGRVTGVFESLG